MTDTNELREKLEACRTRLKEIQMFRSTCPCDPPGHDRDCDGPKRVGTEWGFGNNEDARFIAGALRANQLVVAPPGGAVLWETLRRVLVFLDAAAGEEIEVHTSEQGCHSAYGLWFGLAEAIGSDPSDTDEFVRSILAALSPAPAVDEETQSRECHPDCEQFGGKWHFYSSAADDWFQCVCVKQEPRT